MKSKVEPQSYRTKKRPIIVEPEVMSRGLVSTKRDFLAEITSGRISGMTERLKDHSPYMCSLKMSNNDTRYGDFFGSEGGKDLLHIMQLNSDFKKG